MIGAIIPAIDALKANKMLKEINARQEIEIPKDIDEIDIKYLEEDYKNTVEAKNRFEDKAKTIIAALTIAITLILNLSKIIDTISKKFNFFPVDILVFLLAVLAIIYMLIAGIMSIQVLIKENLLYFISLSERTKQNKKCIYIKTRLNVNQNLIRNNIIFSAYKSIRNSVLCLVIIFVLAIIPFTVSNTDVAVYENQERYSNLNFGIGAVQWLSENKDKDIFFDKIIDAYNKNSNDDETKSIYDNENNILFLVKRKEGVYIIDKIISNIEEIY